MQRIPAAVGVTVALTLVLTACGDGAIDAGPVEDGALTSAEGPDADDPEPTADDTDATDDTDEANDTPGEDGPEADAHDDEASDDTADAEASDDTTAVRLYFMAPGGDTPARADPFLVAVHREIPSTPGIAAATLRALIDGPVAAEEDLIDGLSTSVPADTLLLGIDIADGVATVDLSREFEAGGGSLSMFSRLAQVVYTVTQFPTVDDVRFHLDGQPVTTFSGEGIEWEGTVTREDLLTVVPTVFVDTPAAGAEVAGGSLRITGKAAVFEANFEYRLETADGTVLDEGFAMSDHGQGWGAVDVTIPYEVDGRTEATLTVWEVSAKDGSVQAKRATPLVLLP